MSNKIRLEKVSELEWYLTLQEYFKRKRSSPKTQENPFLDMTIEKFHQLYEEIRVPTLWDKTGVLGFYCPFDDYFVINPGKMVEIPLAYGMEEGYKPLQPFDNLSIRTKKIRGRGMPLGTSVEITNISDEPVLVQMVRNEPFCMFNTRTKEQKTGGQTIPEHGRILVIPVTEATAGNGSGFPLFMQFIPEQKETLQTST